MLRSVSRGELNHLLLETAVQAGTEVHFGMKCVAANLDSGELTFEGDGGPCSLRADVIFGCDGNSSLIRAAIEARRAEEPFRAESLRELDYGYKELSVLPGRRWRRRSWPRLTRRRPTGRGCDSGRSAAGRRVSF